jgi:ADP-glucose pyrophosphorylase
MPPGGLVDPSARIGPNAEVVDSVVGAGAEVGAGAHVRGCVLLPAARVADRAILQNAVVDGGGPVW